MCYTLVPFNLIYCIVQNIYSQNMFLSKVTLRFVTISLMIYFISINLSDTSITLTSFILKRENYPDFQCINAMHIRVCSLFLVSNSWDITHEQLKSYITSYYKGLFGAP